MRILTLLALFLPTAASAMSVDWTGTYRFEWVQVDRPSLATPAMRKAYGLNYLGLSPRIIASDGVDIVAKFDVLAAQSPYENSQLGQQWGLGLSGASAPGNSNVQAREKQATSMNVRELYLNVNQEYGSLLVGRAPFEFGLGINWNAGRGPFDHWTTSSDLVAYKFIVGNLSFTPMFARVSAPAFAQSNTVQDQSFQLQYSSEESGSVLGVIISRRQSSLGSNDIPLGNNQVGGDGLTQSGTVTDAYSMQTTGFTLARKWDSFRFNMEAAFVTGNYGVTASNGEDVQNNSYGLAIELDFPRPESKWKYGVRLGMASGDDPETTDIESFQFHRNYDVAMLLFNHRLGQADFLGTRFVKDGTLTLDTSADDESISNAIYLSPKITYAWNDRWDIGNTLTYAQLLAAPSANSVDFKKDLGLEWDIELVYKPRDNVRWVNEIGLLFPGAAFKNGSANLDNGFNYGFSTKAAITF